MEIIKTNAPDGWYDAKLANASYEKREDGSGILELEFDVGEQYYRPRESIWLVNAPSGDPATDANRKEWTRNSVERLKEVYPEAVKDGKLQMGDLLNADASIADKLVRVRVAVDGNGYSKAKVFAAKAKKPRVSKEDAMKMLMKDQRALAAFGISIEDALPETIVATEVDPDTLPF